VISHASRRVGPLVVRQLDSALSLDACGVSATAQIPLSVTPSVIHNGANSRIDQLIVVRISWPVRPLGRVNYGSGFRTR